MRTKRLFAFAGIIFIFVLGAGNASAQHVKRDHLTEKEADVVRDTQEIDKRMGVFVKFIERRLAVLSGSAVDPVTTKEKHQKNEDGEDLDWGDMPKGTTAELYHDIEGILDEAINNIDDVATREPGSKLMMKGAKVLGAECVRILPQLKTASEKATDRDEKQSLLNAIEYAQSVIDSMGKVPADIDEKEKPDNGKDKKDKKEKKPGE